MPAFKGKFIPYNLKNKDVTADPLTYPISWETDVNKVIEQMRGNQEMCFWLFDNVMECIAGTGLWKIDVRTGNKLPSEVTTPSAKGLFWVLMKSHWKDWEHKASSAGGGSEDGSTTSSLMTNSEVSLMLFTKQNKGSTKDGWTREGLDYFNQVVEKVKADWASKGGKEFEQNFKAAMKERAESSGANKRKQRQDASCRVKVSNNLSDDDGEQGDGSQMGP